MFNYTSPVVQGRFKYMCLANSLFTGYLLLFINWWRRIRRLQLQGCRLRKSGWWNGFDYQVQLLFSSLVITLYRSKMLNLVYYLDRTHYVRLNTRKSIHQSSRLQLRLAHRSTLWQLIFSLFLVYLLTLYNYPFSSWYISQYKNNIFHIL